MIEKTILFVKKNPILLVTIALCLLFLKFNNNLEQEFKQADIGYKEKSIVNLTKGLKVADLSHLLFTTNYVSDSKDADFIAEQIAAKLNEGKTLSNLYELNKQAFHISARFADSLGDNGLKKRIERSCEILGVNSVTKVMQNETLSNIIKLSNGSGKISVIVQQIDTTANKIFKKLNFWNKKPASNVLVQLKEHYYDSLQVAQDSILGYAKTNEQGFAAFEKLDTRGYYSVLPIKEGFEYGAAKGTANGNLGMQDNGTRKFTFTQKEHTIRLFDNLTFQQIREDNALTVRTPADFNNDLLKYLILFFVAWWGLYFMLIWKKKQFSRGIIALLMLLTGFCLLIMFSIHNPLADKMLGVDMAQGIIVGIVIIAVLQWVDFIKFFQDGSKIKFDFSLQLIHWLFTPFREKVKPLTAILKDTKKNSFVKFGVFIIIILCTPLLILDLLQITKLNRSVKNLFSKLPKGFGYLFMALCFTVLLWSPFGSEVGGMKVNLNFGFLFQPSEIAKYLIVVFLAAFFSKNVSKIVKYSESGNSSLFRSKVKVLLIVLVGLGLLLGLYLALGDMGPALVLGISFILLYSIIKSKVNLDNLSQSDKYERIFTCDFAMLLYGILSFALMLVIGSKLNSMGIFCLLWFVLWIAFGLIRKKQIFESAILMNLVIAAFIFGGIILKQTPLQSEGKRLDSRKEMCTNTWGTLGLEEDEVQKAGENNQVAQGLWGLASGGIWGQGLGQGNPNLIPAFHTDMILESIGEQMGWVGLLVIVVCLALLLRKCIVIGYKVAHPFAFYLATGIAIVTGVQFMVIALGSTGIIPLTGVTVPFLSFGKVSMILNLASFGIVLSLSQMRNEVVEQQKDSISSYNYPIAITSLSYSLLAVFVLLVFFNYQFFNRNETLIRPMFVNTTAKGEPIIEYNPRISILTKKMYIGNIYDRNGQILATSDKTAINESDYIAFGVDKEEIDKILKKRTKRYYPFGNNLFFMLGDYNSGVFFSYNEDNPIGYLAEVQHLAALRGFDNVKYDKDGNPLKVNLHSTEYRDNTFLYQIDRERKDVVLRDYSYLIPFLKAGVNSKKVENFNQKREERDIQLTIDAELQTKMQNEISRHIAEKFMNEQENYKNSNLNKMRVSVVVLNSSNGELLCSANYPLPNQDVLRNAPYRYDEKDLSEKAYTDRDLGLTYQTPPGSTAKVMSALAGFMKLGKQAGNVDYYIDAKEVIEPPHIEPNFQKDGHNTTMLEAIKISSNVYFINLINDKDLYVQLDSIYRAVGIRLDKGNKPLTPYFFTYNNQWNRFTEEYRGEVLSVGNKAVQKYRNYIEKRDANRNNLSVYEKMNNGKLGWSWHGWAWGQGSMSATPLNMARVVSIVANEGNMPETKFILKGNKDLKTAEETSLIPIIGKEEAKILQGFMKEEAKKWNTSNKVTVQFPANMGGKTGTPERDLYYKVYNEKKGKEEIRAKHNLNDAWYVFFVKTSKFDGVPLSIAIRIERSGAGSVRAVQLAYSAVLQALKDANYEIINE